MVNSSNSMRIGNIYLSIRGMSASCIGPVLQTCHCRSLPVHEPPGQSVRMRKFNHKFPSSARLPVATLQACLTWTLPALPAGLT